MHPAGIPCSTVVFSVHGLGEDDRALVAQLLDEDVVARRKVDVIGRVAAAGRAHVLGVERVLERKYDAVHRHRLEVWVAAILRIEFIGSLQGIWLLAEELAYRRRTRRERAERRMLVELAPTGHRPLAADVDRAERIELVAVGDADDHAELLLSGGLGRRWLHAAELQWWAFVAVEIREDVGGLRGGGGKAQRRSRPDGACCLEHWRAVCSHELAGDAIVAAHTREILLDDATHGRRAGADRRMQFLDRRFFDTERRPHGRLFFHREPPIAASANLLKRLGAAGTNRSSSKNDVRCCPILTRLRLRPTRHIGSS